MKTIAFMPLQKNVSDGEEKGWTLKRCPKCGQWCWETNAFRCAKSKGIIKGGLCTECALRLGAGK